jgi:acyl-CoA thioester hydrolase
MMGVVYHANYLPVVRGRRTQLLKEQNFPYRQLEADGFRLPVLEVSAKYRGRRSTTTRSPSSPPCAKNRCCASASNTKFSAATSCSPPAKAPTRSSIAKAARCGRPPAAFVARMNERRRSR